MSRTLAEAYPEAQAHVRKMIEEAKGMRGTLGVNMEFYIAACEDLLQRADKAAAEQDTVAMIRLLAEMQDVQ